MTVRRATDADAKRISEIAQPYGFGDEDEFKLAIAHEDAVWVVDDEGGSCQIERKKEFTTISVGPLLPLEDLGTDRAQALLRGCIVRAYEEFSSEREWKIITYVPAENRQAANAFVKWFELTDDNIRRLRNGAVVLTLPTMKIAYERSQRWQVL